MLNILFKISFLAVIVLLGIILFTSKMENPLGLRSYVVLTGSMKPALDEGSIIFVKKQDNYVPDDVVSFKQGNVVITHRIVEFGLKDGKPVFRTKGDANNKSDDALLNKDMILGKQIFSIPYVGKLVFFIKTLPGFLTLVIFPAFLYIAMEMYSIKNEIEKEVSKKYSTV